MADFTSDQILSLVRICCCVALRDESQLREECLRAIRGNLTIALVREAVLQSYLFAGYASAINAFIIINEIAGEDRQFFQEPSGSLGEWKSRGEDLCRQIYGSQYEKLVHNMKQLHPDLADWMLWEGYGKVLARPFLTPVVRELLIVAMTAVLQVQRQFHSHVRGALNVGATPQQLKEVFSHVRGFMGDAADSYQNILDSVLTK